MEFNQDTIKGKWKEIKGEIQKAWGKLTDDELEQTKGDVKSIAGLVQQKYGEDKESFRQKFSGMMDRFEVRRDGFTDSIKQSLKNDIRN